MIVEEFRDRLYEYIGGILDENDSRLVAAGGMPDHVHLLASINKELSISAALRLIKSNSSKWIHEEFPVHSEFAWQAGYGAFAVSFSKLDTVKVRTRGLRPWLLTAAPTGAIDVWIHDSARSLRRATLLL